MPRRMHTGCLRLFFCCPKGLWCKFFSTEVIPKGYRRRRENGGIRMIICTRWEKTEMVLKYGTPVSIAAENSLL